MKRRATYLAIIVYGVIGQDPRVGGVTSDYLRDFLCLARSGDELYYFDDTGEWPYAIDGGPPGRDWLV